VVCLLSFTAGVSSVSAQTTDRAVEISLPAGDLANSLDELGDQSGVQVMYDPAVAKGVKAPAVSGKLTVSDALEQLLAHTGLKADRVNDKTVVLKRAEPNKDRVDGPPQARSSSPSDASGGVEAPIEEVVVTGSHIARPELESAMPVAVIKMESARNFGYETAYDALLLNPAVGPGLGNSNSQGDTWDVGVANINLRNMGINRTLVLVDGERWVSGGARTAAVDINTIPDAMIDRFEVVTGGAAAIYGPDAVTGAVNIIMKKDISGVNLSATSGLSQHGDANQTSVAATTGLKFGDADRGSFVFGGTYTHTAPLRDSDRFPNRVQYVTNPAYTGPNSGPVDILDYNTRYLQRSPYPTFLYGYVPNVNPGQWYMLRNGVLSPTAYNYSIAPGPLGSGDGGGGANGDENHFLRDASRTGSLYSHLSYELTPSVTWNAMLSYANTYARADTVFPEVRDDSRPTNWWGGTTGEVATLTNPFLPASLQQFMIANNLTSLPLDRTYANLPEAYEIHNRNNVTVGTDIGGALTEKLKWTAYVRYGQVTDDVTTTNMIRHTEWLNARDVIAAPVTGQPECASAAAQAAGCVPFNIFTTDAPSQAFLNYVEADRHETRKNSLVDNGGSISGSLFRLPYGDVSGATGVEWRRETLSTRDDPDTAKLSDILFRPGEDYIAHPALDAARETTELYGEVVIPVLADLPFARRWGIEGAYRYSHYSDEAGTGTWKFGTTWEPFNGFTLRGVVSHSVRVPNFGELYSPVQIQTVGVTADPCSGVFITAGPNRAKNCAALLPGVPLPLPYPNTNAPVIDLGGNSNLTPETSRSYTLGAVFQPQFLPGLDLTLDYWSIAIDNAITAIPYATILNLCADSASGANNFYCNLISRNPANGQIVTIQAANYNLAAEKSRGIDLGVNYRHGIGPGLLQLGFNGTYLMEQTTVAAQGAPGIDYAGQWDFPRFTGSLMTYYSIGMVTLGLNTRYISRSVYNVTAPTPNYYSPSHVPTYVDNDLTIQVRPTEKYSLTLGVKNVFNESIFGPLQDTTGSAPNSSGGAQTGAAYYDAVGRYFFLKVDAKL
jgi:outer membrane receptor protein involved in Fe transport